MSLESILVIALVATFVIYKGYQGTLSKTNEVALSEEQGAEVDQVAALGLIVKEIREELRKKTNQIDRLNHIVDADEKSFSALQSKFDKEIGKVHEDVSALKLQGNQAVSRLQEQIEKSKASSQEYSKRLLQVAIKSFPTPVPIKVVRDKENHRKVVTYSRYKKLKGGIWERETVSKTVPVEDEDKKQLEKKKSSKKKISTAEIRRASL